MEDNHQPSSHTIPNTTTTTTTNNNSSNSNSNSSSSEGVRSRWTPKPEQILILESIFNSGMVNPPKEETVRIRRLLEKFGAVGDANVFYWFQNRRSRSRRRQRQLQAAAAATTSTVTSAVTSAAGGHPPLYYDYGGPTQTSGGVISSSSCFGEGLYGGGFSGEMMGISVANHQIMETNSTSPSVVGLSDTSTMEFPPGIITVFVNGVATQVPEGPLDVKAMFGEDVILVHSSGVPVPFNDYGISFQTLQHGESYFLVPRLG